MALRNALHEAEVNRSAITANAVHLLQGASTTLNIADIRADAYGHGALESALAAAEGGANALGVSSAAEALLLHQRGIRLPFVSLQANVLRALPKLTPEGLDFNDARILGPELYGLNGAPNTIGAMRVTAKVVGIKTIAAGEGVSYGHTYRASEVTNLALVALGYANGLDRFASNTARILLGGALRLVAGRVAMNACVLELGSDTIAVGEEAVLAGLPADGEPSMGDWASALAKDSSETASVLGSHLPRRYS